MFETQMRGQAELVEALIGGVRSIAQSYETSMQIERAARVAEVGGQAGSNPEIMAMLQLAMAQLMKPPAALPASPKEKKP